MNCPKCGEANFYQPLLSVGECCNTSCSLFSEKQSTSIMNDETSAVPNTYWDLVNQHLVGYTGSAFKQEKEEK